MWVGNGEVGGEEGEEGVYEGKVYEGEGVVRACKPVGGCGR